jgi:hypothetical protein
MSTDTEYDDGRVAVDQTGVTLRRYYFPSGHSKHIPYGQIRAVSARPMTWWNGKGRLWGSADLQCWLPLDVHRNRRDQLVVLDLGGFVQPGFSPDDADLFVDLVRGHVAAQ